LHRNYLLKHIVEGKIGETGQEDKKEDVSRYWMTVRKREGTED
jgi:hypothetical protein